MVARMCGISSSLYLRDFHKNSSAMKMVPGLANTNWEFTSLYGRTYQSFERLESITL